MTPSAPVFSWKIGLSVFLAILLLSLPQAVLLPLFDRDEPRFAEASREMLQSDNFIVPTFNHAPRYAKPPLIYWCQAAAYEIFGENAFAARLPSLLATAGTALLLVAWGVEMGSGQMALGAALSYAFCFQTVQQGRVATADALLIFFMTLTAYAGWKVITARHTSHSTRSYLWDTLLALGFAGGFLAKGPEAFLPLVPLLVCARGIRPRLVAEILVNFCLGLALVLFWAIPAYVMTNGDYWRVGMSEGVGERMVSGLQGHGASTFGWYLLGLLFYVVLFWISALPWSPLIVTQRKKLFAGWKPDRTDTYLLLNAGLIFLIFTLMVTKLPHYTLPAFPFLALLLARRWKSVGLSPGYLTKLGWISGAILALLALILIPVALACHASPSPVGILVRDAQNVLTPQTEFALADFQEPTAVWEMRRIVTGYGQFIGDADVLPFLQQPGPRAVVLSSASWEKLRTNAHSEWKIFEARGLNAAKFIDSSKRKFALVDLVLVVKP
jgi:4-amino-4-deoxy-L-arabinose transferase-like glycosyltransferase